MSAKDASGHLAGGWEAFYKTSHDTGQGRPQLRTYEGRQAEKFFEAFALPEAPMRPGKHAPPPRPESLAWGIGGTVPCGRMQLRPFPAREMGLSQKRYLVPKESEEVQMRIEMGRKGTVLDAAGRDSKHRLSDGFVLEDVMQRKTRVPEEARTDQRTIHRWAPPGLKGYMGAEYSNDFYTSAYLPNGFGRGRVSEAERPSAGTGATRKSFREKRVEEEVAEQVALVERLRQPLEHDDDDPEEVAAD